MSTGRQNHTATRSWTGGSWSRAMPRSMAMAARARRCTTWPPTAGLRQRTMYSERSLHAATLLRAGKVLITGGAGPGMYIASAELYTAAFPGDPCDTDADWPAPPASMASAATPLAPGVCMACSSREEGRWPRRRVRAHPGRRRSGRRLRRGASLFLRHQRPLRRPRRLPAAGAGHPLRRGLVQGRVRSSSSAPLRRARVCAEGDTRSCAEYRRVAGACLTAAPSTPSAPTRPTARRPAATACRRARRRPACSRRSASAGSAQAGACALDSDEDGTPTARTTALRSRTRSRPTPTVTCRRAISSATPATMTTTPTVTAIRWTTAPSSRTPTRPGQPRWGR